MAERQLWVQAVQKTLFDTKFGCPRTIVNVPIVDPAAFYEVDAFLHSSFPAFSHSLGRLRPVAFPESSHSVRRGDDRPAICGLWRRYEIRLLIDATVNLDFAPEEQYGGERYPPSVMPDKEDWDRAGRRWKELGFKD